MNRPPDTTLYITTLTVTGMRWGGCAVRLAGALEAVTGVVHVDVHERRNEIIVEHLPAFVGADAVAAAIRAIGYGAEVGGTVPEVEGARPAKVEYDRSFNLGTSTIG